MIYFISIRKNKRKKQIRYILAIWITFSLVVFLCLIIMLFGSERKDRNVREMRKKKDRLKEKF